jgi:hypothetical protein
MISPTWATKKKLERSDSNPVEISNLLVNADRKILDSGLISDSKVSTDTYQAVVFNAAILCMKAVLRASGYQTAQNTSGGHDVLIRALAATMDTRNKYAPALEKARKQRIQTTYIVIGNADREDVDKLLVLVKALRVDVAKYIRRHHPSLINS